MEDIKHKIGDIKEEVQQVEEEKSAAAEEQDKKVDLSKIFDSSEKNS